MRRAILLFVVLGVLTLAVGPPALTQEGETQGAAQYGQGAGETQYEQGVAEAGCDWYWGNKWNAAGAWEYWCWDPQLGGWWYAISEDGKKKLIHTTQPGAVLNTA
jgi:hypothetical protein